ncbi:hypothetical protein AWB79_05200 [Caballeronia hypogeia]|uniref:Uncharacterized protein n=1 Tax=Caballeronia hypogeia TaxID=1777140 RepID=A0A158CDU9_9BURK|nr:hypothetical protein [Caballeronia hypogeia]SAK80515.1 hypothetical protein AWB79_05200 [Caballeronia hypogeia]
MSWLNLIGTITVGAVMVLALVAVFEIVFRTPREKRLPEGHSKKSEPATARTHGPTRGQEFKGSNSGDR